MTFSGVTFYKVLLGHYTSEASPQTDEAWTA